MNPAIRNLWARPFDYKSELARKCTDPILLPTSKSLASGSVKGNHQPVSDFNLQK